MSGKSGPDIIENGIVLYLDASNIRSYPGSGTTWTDLSGNSNNGTLTNGPTFSATNGGCIVFDGVDDHISITETLGMNPNVLTLECVFEVLSDTNSTNGGAPNTHQFIAFRQNSRTAAYEGYILYYDETNRRVEIITTPSGGGQYILSSTNNSVALNTKVHVTVLFDTSQQSIYINGNLKAGPTAKATGIDYNVTHTLKLGKANAIGSTYDACFNGRIYTFRIYNKVLTTSEILQNYNATKSRFGL